MPIGIPAAIALSSIIGGGASIAGAALAGKPKTSTSTSGPTFTPEQQSLSNDLLSFSGGIVKDPSAGMGPLKMSQMGAINRNYDNAPRIISSQMARRGYGSSGSMGDTMYKTDLSRLGDLSQFQGNWANMLSNRQMQGADLGTRLLSSLHGTTTTGTTPDYSAGNAFMSGGNALGNLSTLLMLQKVLSPGVSPGVSNSELWNMPSPGVNTSLLNWGPGAGTPSFDYSGGDS